MFSSSGVQQHSANAAPLADSVTTQPSSVPPAPDCNVIQVPSVPERGALARIEDLLESIVDAISNGTELIIPFRTARSLQNGANAPASQRDERQADVVRFPGRTVQEVKRFGTSSGTGTCREYVELTNPGVVAEALFRIIEMSHEALLSGKVVTKR
jgi:meiotic recombination protein SPO11